MSQPIMLGYIRVSTDKQTDSGAGLEGQRIWLRAEAIRNNAQLEIISEEKALSGKSTSKRIALNEALNRLDRGEAQVLAVSKLDRLSRSVSDFLAILERSRKNNWTLIIGDIAVDTSTPMGQAMATISATFAQLERARIGERTRDALAVKKSQGVQLGGPLRIPREIRERILHEINLGHGYTATSQILNAEMVPTVSGKAWYPSTIRTVHLRGVS